MNRGRQFRSHLCNGGVPNGEASESLLGAVKKACQRCPSRRLARTERLESKRAFVQFTSRLGMLQVRHTYMHVRGSLCSISMTLRFCRIDHLKCSGHGVGP